MSKISTKRNKLADINYFLMGLYVSFMNNYIAFTIEYNDKEEYFSALEKIRRIMNNHGYQYWYMNKQYNNAQIRLRVKDENIGYDDLYNEISGEIIGKCKKFIYDPEVFLFGGEEGIDIAHKIFCLITEIINLLSNVKDKKNNLIFIYLWISKILVEHIADDSFEQWDCWKRLQHQRKFIGKLNNELLEKNIQTFKSIKACTEKDVCEIINFINVDYEVFSEIIIQIKIEIGKMKDLHYEGKLCRGIRSIAPALLIFIWNMVGFTSNMQSVFTYCFCKVYSPEEDYNE